LVIFGNLDGSRGAVAGPEWSRTRDALTRKPAFKAAKELNQWWQDFRHEHHAASSPHRTTFFTPMTSAWEEMDFTPATIAQRF